MKVIAALFTLFIFALQLVPLVLLAVVGFTTYNAIQSNGEKRDVCIEVCEDQKCKSTCIMDYSLLCSNGIFISPTCD